MLDDELIDTSPIPSNAVAGNDVSDLWLGEDIARSLEAIPDPERFWMAVTQVSIKRRVGSIIIPDTAVDDQKWSHGLAIVVKVGPTVYRGKRFEDIGLTQDDAFKAGDLVYFNASAPRRIFVDNRLYLYIPDDAVMARPDRKHIHRIKFTI